MDRARRARRRGREKDPGAVTLDDRQRAMVDYAVKLTTSPGDVDERDVGSLRAAGFDDVDISDINGVCASKRWARHAS